MKANRLTWRTEILGRYTFPYVYWDNFFDEEAIQAMEKYCNDAGTEEAMVINERGEASKTDARKSKSRIHNVDGGNLWLFERMRLMTEHANSEYFNFDLLGFDYFQYTEYSNTGDHYDWHSDLIYGAQLPTYMNFPRKLSFIYTLSDSSEFTGGELQFKPDTDNPVAVEQKRGRLFAFPSWVLHRITPIQSGTRRSLVWWCSGPKFR
jgi:hypothetical protein